MSLCHEAINTKRGITLELFFFTSRVLNDTDEIIFIFLLENRTLLTRASYNKR